ncbi:type II toxin-antitoxin system RelB/DinJ family antitoxin [Paucilactobacillus suebicus]|nr:type II toxin-antitoxin system RelB/DinJ family antitoxin [Paucilactobacillus suebicus]
MLAKKNNSKKRIQVNIDKDLVDNAEEILDKLGLNTTTALTMFYKKIVATDGIPFDLQLTKEQKANANLEDALKAVPQQNIKNNKEAEKVLFDDEN